MLNNEERQAAEITDLRNARDAYAAEKKELEIRLNSIAALIAAPLADEEADVAAFGRDAWVYCSQHMRAHQTGWCSVNPRDKVGLGVTNADEAQQKCRDWGFKLYADLHPNG